MKTTAKFNKGFLPCAIISGVIIVFGIVGFFVKGINLGLDFKPGLLEEIKITAPVAEVTYSGSSNIAVELERNQLVMTVTGVGSANESRELTFTSYPTLAALAAELEKEEGVSVKIAEGKENSPASELFRNSVVTNQLTNDVLYLYATEASESQLEKIREVLGSKGVDVKQLGSGSSLSYQIRTGFTGNVNDEGEVQEAQESMVAAINTKLYEMFGKQNVVTVKQDYTNPSMSRSTTIKSIIMFVCVILLIWVYAAIRFHWDFALGSIVALIHDACIMFTFIIWSNMEFSSTVLAAVLTIMGYSINATVVILDRIRYNLKMMPEAKTFKDILNRALSDTFTRSVLTTVTTLFAVVSLYVFTTGSIKNFALAMIVGLISGMYSSIFISSGFIALARKNWKPEFGIHHSLKHSKSE